MSNHPSLSPSMGSVQPIGRSVNTSSEIGGCKQNTHMLPPLRMVYHNVVGLHIAMHDAFRMTEVQCLWREITYRSAHTSGAYSVCAHLTEPPSVYVSVALLFSRCCPHASVLYVTYVLTCWLTDFWTYWLGDLLTCTHTATTHLLAYWLAHLMTSWLLGLCFLIFLTLVSFLSFFWFCSSLFYSLHTTPMYKKPPPPPPLQGLMRFFKLFKVPVICCCYLVDLLRVPLSLPTIIAFGGLYPSKNHANMVGRVQIVVLLFA